MAHEFIDVLVRFNLVLAAAIALVLSARAPMRRMFGARVAYALWLIPPLAAAMCFAPQRTLVITLPDAPSFDPAPVAVTHGPHLVPLLLWIWLGGAALFLLVLAFRQARFVRSLGRLVARGDLGARVFGAETNKAGPAVVGALRPVIVAPANFEERYSEAEREIVLAHERAHLAHGDPLINAAAALLQSVNWFNPLIHIGVRALRVDQEFACDAAVIGAAHGVRRLYAETMLKTHASTMTGPLVCAWPPTNIHPLKERIAMLKRNPPNRVQLALGASVVALVTLGVCTTAWTAQPTKVIAMQAPHVAPVAPVAPIAPADAIAPVAPTEPLLGGDGGDETDVADGSDDPNIDTSELEANARALSLHAMRIARQAMESADADQHAHLTPQEREQMRAEAEQVRVEAMRAARVAMAQARLELRQQEPAMRAAMADQARELREHARDIRERHQRGEDTSTDEAQLEAEAQRVAVAAMQIASQAMEHAFDAPQAEDAPEAPDDAQDKDTAPH